MDRHRAPAPAATLLENSGNFSYRIPSRPLVRGAPAPHREGSSGNSIPPRPIGLPTDLPGTEILSDLKQAGDKS